MVEINEEWFSLYNIGSQIIFKTTLWKSSLCVCNDAYVLVKGTITITGAGADVAAKQAHERSKYYLKIVHHFPNVWTK